MYFWGGGGWRYTVGTTGICRHKERIEDIAAVKRGPGNVRHCFNGNDKVLQTHATGVNSLKHRNLTFLSVPS